MLKGIECNGKYCYDDADTNNFIFPQPKVYAPTEQKEIPDNKPGAGCQQVQVGTEYDGYNSHKPFCGGRRCVPPKPCTPYKKQSYGYTETDMVVIHRRR